MRRPSAQFALLVGLALIFGVLFPRLANALESAPVSSDRATVTLVSDTDTVAPGKPFRVALRLQLAPGWHTYWRNPGDAGAPPELNLELPPGSQTGAIEWPTPRRISQATLMSYAYTGDVLLPVTVTLPKEDTGPVTVRAHATWLVCKDICIPEEGDFRIDLAAGTPAPSAQHRLFAMHDRDTPRPSPWQATLDTDGTLWVHGPELSASTVADAWFIPDRGGIIQDSAAQPLSVEDGGFTLALRLAKGFDPSTPLDGVLSVRDRAGLQTNVQLHATPGPAPRVSDFSAVRILGFAFLGGLILNLMPCVFPILAMKAVALADGAMRGKGRGHAVSYAAGVVLTFAVLGAVLLVMRKAGAAAGWGFQLASPAFVAAMAWLLFGIGLNLSGVFRIGSGLAGAGNSLTAARGHAGSFFTGLLAVLVATPCTAPFMGAAIAAGLAAPPAMTMLVFIVMGAGLAAPYVLLAGIPRIGRVLPRPGPWMEWFRQALAFPMYGAAVWLLWVISQEAGPPGVLATSAGFVLLGFGAWIFGLTQAAAERARRMGSSAAIASVLGALTILTGITAAPAASSGATFEGAEPFSPTRLAELRASGQPVFVDMTAAWCVTCLVNERVALRTDAVQRAFAARHVTYMLGDWTRQDPKITAYLRENGRDGVPLYVYYPPGGGRPAILPQILTENMVLQELQRG
jgi:thiol:disulfide interchange protein DsbD